MTSARRSQLSAAVLFVLTAAVVLGGMGWATAAHYELAKKNVGEAHRTLVLHARGKLDAEIQGILNGEASRPYTDYIDRHSAQPLVVTTNDGRQLDPFTITVQLASSIAQQGARWDWIDLHFQIDQDGAISSPQIPEEDTAWPVEVEPMALESDRRAKETWAWFQRIAPELSLRYRLADRFRSLDEDLMERDDEVTDHRMVRVVRGSARSAAGGSAPSAVRQQRAPQLTEVQELYFPPVQCVDPRIAERNTRSMSKGADDDDEFESAVRISTGPFAPPFWLESEGSGFDKLVFVRECLADAIPFYQGFVGDWSRLRLALLAKIDDVFPEADLEPVPNNVNVAAADTTMPLSHLPALLRVPEVRGGLAAQAWSSIRIQVLISWAAAATVLLVAGWGVRNLVALTERRMQFAYAVTHELRTPLTTFRLYADMLSAGMVPESARPEYLETLNRESRRLSSLVEGVLEYARLENQKVRLHLSETNGPDFLRAIGETLHQRCEENGIKAVARNHLPAGRTLQTDINVVRQIAGVLLNNACRHARTSADPTVLMELGGTDGKVFLDVIDSGPGIDRTDARRIFKPFRRGKDAETTARGGVGLGLALARNWAILLGGRLELLARHHPQFHGAHFRLTIPAETGNHSGIGSIPSSPTSRGRPISAGRGRPASHVQSSVVPLRQTEAD